ncbi:MAG: glutathione S-transferase C-terminal domain-containing protein [Rhodobacteraceae bacterium]|jgi:glutathione S-transferase|nr:glutathione S-transferase C-terminal domain-containing protein [Paracoccaceae bacterium]
MTAKLYCFGESGNAYKAALTLALAGCDWQPVFVDFFGGETRSPAFRALNPMGEVPVYVDGDLVLTQSGVIQLHVAETTGRLGGRDAAERREVLRWLFWDNHKGSSQNGAARFLMNFIPEGKRPPGVADWLTGRMRAAWKVLEDHLKGRDWIVGSGPTIADCACAGYLYYPEPFGFSRAEWPAIDRWLSRLSAQPGWRHPYELMPRRRPV